MSVLLDTNILLRLADRGSPHHEAARRAVERLAELGLTCVLVPQVLYEYWVVATRPSENNGLGLSAGLASQAVHGWTDLFSLLLDERGVFSRWQVLTLRYDVKGKSAHDARLVAAMLRHGISHLLTFNKPDFNRYTEIVVWTPDRVADGSVSL